MRVFLVIVGLVVAGCSGSSGGDCDQIARAINEAATRRGLPTNGVCTTTDPDVQRDFGKACAELKACND